MTTRRLRQRAALPELTIHLPRKDTPAVTTDQQAGNEKLAAAIGRNVRRLREENELSLEQLAKLAEVEPATLRHIESACREPTIGELWKVARILQVPCVSLLSSNEPGQAIPHREQEIATGVDRRQGTRAILASPLQ